MSNLEQQKKERIAIASSQQRLAADPKVSVWVEASAGTGKTKVLSDRVLRLLLDGVNPSRILCLTYTKAAAVEMNNRIAERLSKWAVMTDEVLHGELEKLLGDRLEASVFEEKAAQARRLFAVLLDTPGGVKIQTIHSFCQEVLKRFPLEARVSPYFEIMDDRTAKEAVESIKKEILQGNTGAETKEALAFLTAEASEFKFPAIMKSIADERNHLEEYLQKYGSAAALGDAVARKLEIGKDETAESVERGFWQNLPEEQIRLLIRAFDEGSDTSKKTAAILAQALEEKDLNAYTKVFLTDGRAKKKPLVKKSLEIYPQAEELFFNEADRLVALRKKTAAIGLYTATRAVLVLSGELLGRYQQYKHRHSKMDYNDLIVLTKRLLETPKVAQWVLFKLDGGIDNVLIDEAQDTSPEQWAIIKALTAEFFSGQGAKEQQPTVFVVGDCKQSIYSFQGADPKEFEKMHDYFASKTSSFRDVNMEVSFRSTAAVLDTVNSVFATDKARDGVAKKEQNIEHVPSRIGDGGRIELWPLTEPDEDDDCDKMWRPPVERITALSSSAKLAQQIAEMIKAKVDSGEKLESKGRPLKYSDFLILVQRRNSFVEEMVRACKNAGVSITGVDKIKLLEQIAINDLIAVAKFALLPEDDLNLACVLKSPLFGLDDDDLFVLCHGRENKTVWQRLKENADYSGTAEILEHLTGLSADVRPFEFFAYILNDLHGRKKFVARLGYECEDALDEFINLTLDFEREHIPSMQLFVDWVLKDDVEIKRDLEQNETDAVRLMTVHGSKGLQAPVVILPDMVRVKQIKQEAGWLKDEDVLFYPLGKENYEDNCCRLKEQEKELSLEEYHRLLYVALTRAEECLCICGYKKKNKPSEESWYEICKSALGNIAELQDEKLIYKVEQQIVPKATEKTEETKPEEKLPEWLFQKVLPEGALAKPLTPSHQDESAVAVLSPLQQNNDEKLYNRGRIIHKLLQFLPETDAASRQKTVETFLFKQAADFSPEERQKIADEVLELVSNPEFAPLFGENSLAEAALMGLVDDRIISGQIDRLVVTDKKVMIVDYKTNRPAATKPEDVPQAYVKQMAAYRKLVEKIYPDKEAVTYILWTNTACMMRIE